MSTQYKYPTGITILQSLASSYKIISDPIALLTMRMKRFGGTYSAFIPRKGRVIVTQDADFVNYVLRENHNNYQKAQLGTSVAVRQFGNSLLFANGDDWRRQR